LAPQGGDFLLGSTSKKLTRLFIKDLVKFVNLFPGMGENAEGVFHVVLRQVVGANNEVILTDEAGVGDRGTQHS
jgi:hypothetical protein